MPFFQGAYDFEINGGNFYEIGRDQTTRTIDSSLNVAGSNNNVDMSPNYSRQDARSFNVQADTRIAYAGPMHGQTSTYPGYGQVPPIPTQVAQMQPQAVPQADPHLMMQYQWYWAQYMAYLNSLHARNQSGQELSPGPSAPEQQRDQVESSVPAQETSRSPPLAITQEGERDEEMERLRESLDRQHIHNHFDYATVPQPSVSPAASRQYTQAFN